MALENERSILKRQLVIEKRKLEENRYLMGGGSTRAAVLITEAQQVGLLDANIPIDYQNYGKLQSVLESVEKWNPSMEDFDDGMDELTSLQSKLHEAQNDLNEIKENLNSAKRYWGETTGYTSEVEHQKLRLESIGLFEKLDLIRENAHYVLEN